jgi:tRNA-dihydrouridine synthase C
MINLSPDYWRPEGARPRLFLAPMEGLGDGFFRRSYCLIGGFDEACTEFLRVPKTAHCRSLAARYHPNETAPYPQAAQIMGDNPQLMAEMTERLVERGAPRIDLNCGCPSNTVVGRGAGSSLLQTPELLFDIARAMVQASAVPVTVKLRAGYADTSQFKDNLLACQEAGAAFITLHPRTKLEGYKPPCHWNLIAEAKSVLDIPVVGSGEVKTAQDALRMWKETGCDGVMVGRGAIRDPWVFHRIRAAWSGKPFSPCWKATTRYLRSFAVELALQTKERTQVNKLKQIASFMLLNGEEEEACRMRLLRSQEKDPGQWLKDFLEMLYTLRFCSEETAATLPS